MNNSQNASEMKETWDELKDTFGEEWIKGYIKYIYSVIERYFDKNGLNEIAFIDPDIFGWCMIDILYDLQRMRDFHELDSISEERLLAYAAAWIIKRKPIQMSQGQIKGQNEYLYVNEKVAFILICKATGIEDGKYNVSMKEREKALRFLDRILYHLRFRNSSPKTLELLIYGVRLGTMLENS
ncbi:MAG: hypothetical protein J5819_04475 [Eubacterium sp.]|nr:hypothetical protein [Eubacterium sp.]